MKERKEFARQEKIGKFSRFKMSKKRGSKSPIEKFQAMVMKLFDIPEGNPNEVGVSDVVVHIDDLRELEAQEKEWFKYHHGTHERWLGLHFLNASPSTSDSEEVKRGMIYLRNRGAVR